MTASAGEPGPEPELEPESLARGQQALWRWFRVVGLPVVALLIIGLAIAVLRRPGGDGGAVRLDRSSLATGEGAAAEEGAAAPDFALQAPDGTTYRLSDLRGKAVVINFWATWCGPCKSEMPAIESVYRESDRDRLIVLAVDVGESADAVVPYVTKLGLTFPVLLDRSGAVSGRYRVTGLPTTVLVRPDGVVDGIRVGPYTRAMLSGRISQLLGD